MTAQEQLLPVEEHWKRNTIVCVLGSFTTIIAMTLLLPFLPLYVEQLGVSDTAAIVQWSGIAFGATFLSAAFCSSKRVELDPGQTARHHYVCRGESADVLNHVH